MIPALIKLLRNGAEMGAALGPNLATGAAAHAEWGLASACVAGTAIFISTRNAIDRHAQQQTHLRVERRLRELLDGQHDLAQAVTLLAAEHDMHEWVATERCDELMRVLAVQESQLALILSEQKDLINLIAFADDTLRSWCENHQIDFALLSSTIEGGFSRLTQNLDRLHEKLNTIGRDLSPPDTTSTEEYVPPELRFCLDEGRRLFNEGKYPAAQAKYDDALKHPAGASYPTARIKARVCIASIVRIDDPDSARVLFRECLDALRVTPAERLQEDVLGRLGEIEVHAGDLLAARAYLIEAQEIAIRLGKRLQIACNLEALAGVADGQGRWDEALALYDQAAEKLLTELNRNDAKTKDEALTGLGICLLNKSETQRHKLDLQGALSSLAQATQWLRTSNSPRHLQRALVRLANARFADSSWETGLSALQEALRIAMNRDDCAGVAQCLDLGGRVKFTLGDRKGAFGDFTAALNCIREKGKPVDLLHYLEKVARLCAKNGLRDEARKLLHEERQLSEEHERFEHFADAVLALAELEEGPDAKAKQQDAVRLAIAKLEQELLKTQFKADRAFLMGRIGSLHQRLDDCAEAMNWFTRARRAFEDIGDVAGIGNCLGAVADIKRLQEKPDEEIDAYRQVLSLAQGTPLHDLVARTKNNMGVRLMQQGFLREAQQLLDEADELCRKRHLQELHTEVLRNIERVARWIEAYKPPTMTLPELVQELHELVAFFPEAKDSILRYWYYVRDTEIHSNCRSLLGVKFFVVEDRAERFLTIVDKLAPFCDLVLQAVNTEFPGWGIDFVPYPKERKPHERVALTQVEATGDHVAYVRFTQGDLHWPYCMTSDEARSDASGNVAQVIFGRAKGLPEQAHELMLGQPANEIVERKVLFFPFERVAEPRLLHDLRLTQEQSLIPVYTGCLPNSDDTEIRAKVEFHFPVNFPARTSEVNRQINGVKRNLVRLLSLQEPEAVAMLTHIPGQLEELRTNSGASDQINMTAHLLSFFVQGATKTHLALVRHE